MIYLIIDYKDEGADPAKVTLPIRTFYMNKFKAMATHEIDPADWEALLAPVYDHTIKGFAINMPDTLTKVAKNFNTVVPSYPHPQRKGAFLKFKLIRKEEDEVKKGGYTARGEDSFEVGFLRLNQSETWPNGRIFDKVVEVLKPYHLHTKTEKIFQLEKPGRQFLVRFETKNEDTDVSYFDFRKSLHHLRRGFTFGMTADFNFSKGFCEAHKICEDCLKIKDREIFLCTCKKGKRQRTDAGPSSVSFGEDDF